MGTCEGAVRDLRGHLKDLRGTCEGAVRDLWGPLRDLWGLGMQCKSPLYEFDDKADDPGILGVRFKRLIMDAAETDRSPHPPEKRNIKRVLLCTGKVAPLPSPSLPLLTRLFWKAGLHYAKSECRQKVAWGACLDACMKWHPRFPASCAIPQCHVSSV